MISIKVDPEDIDRVLSAARRRSHELLDQVSEYDRKGFAETSKETFDDHYKPLKEAIDRVKAAAE